MKLALWQTAGFPADTVANLGALETTARAAATAGASLLLCPECWLCGYNIGAAVATLAEQRDGISSQVIAGIARRNNIAIRLRLTRSGIFPADRSTTRPRS